MNNARSFLLITVCLVIAQTIYAQQYFVKSYTIENGLPTRFVSDACQDSSGIMWFATNCGISAYDGFSFTNYDATNGIPYQEYMKVKCDEKGILWGIPVKSYDTVIWMQNNIWNRIVPAAKTSIDNISSFDLYYKDGNPVLCLGTPHGLDIYQNGRWNHVVVSKNSADNQILSVISKGDKFYVLTKTGVFIVYRNQTGWDVKEYVKSPGEAIIAINFERPGTADEKLWMLFNNHLSYLKNGMLKLYTRDFALPETFLPGNAYLNFDKRGNIFFGNKWSKYFFNRKKGTVAPLMIKNGLSSNGASSIFIDREQNLWFTDTRGIDKINNLLMLNFYESNGLLENEVSAVVNLTGGGMVFGHNIGLSVFDGHNFKRITFPVRPGYLARVLDLVQDTEGNVWFAASRLGFGKLKSDGTIKWYRIDSTSSANTILQDVHGKIWMGTDIGLYYLQKDKLIAFNDKDKIKYMLRKIFLTRNGDIIGIGSNGIYKISGDEINEVPIAEDVKTRSFFSYYQNSSGVEYVGTSNGLCVIENGRVQKLTKSGIKIDSPVYFIFQDKDKNYWLGSDNGAIKWDNENKLETYSLQNGLAGRETNRSAGIVDSGGNVWIGTDMGLSCFLPGFSDLKTRPPVIKLLDFEDNSGENHSFVDNCTIGFNSNTLFFHFRGISFVNEDLISYRYRLDGFENRWQYVNQAYLHKVKYAGLAPGKYRFIVQARNQPGDWSELAQSGTISIAAPFYHKLWFNLILILVICLIIFSAIKIILQHRYKLKLEKEINERKKSEQKTAQTLLALHTSELKYRELIEFAVDGILIVSKERIITGANSCIQKLTGRAIEELIGVHINQLFIESHLNKEPLRFDLVEMGEIIVHCRELHRPDGTSIPVEIHMKMMPDGSYQSIFHDITNRKKAEETLRGSRELYKLITDKMTDVVWLMDLKGRSTFVSQSIVQFTGYSAEEYMQQSVEEWFTPESAAIARVLFRSEMGMLNKYPERLQGFSFIQRMEYVCKNGATKWGELLMTPYFGANNEWLGIHGVTRDVTDRKLTEEALNEKANELERFNRLMIGRELKMIELKTEINVLSNRLGEGNKYVIHQKSETAG